MFICPKCVGVQTILNVFWSKNMFGPDFLIPLRSLSSMFKSNFNILTYLLDYNNISGKKKSLIIAFQPVLNAQCLCVQTSSKQIPAQTPISFFKFPKLVWLEIKNSQTNFFINGPWSNRNPTNVCVLLHSKPFSHQQVLALSG